MKPVREDFTPDERKVIDACRTPLQVHSWLRSMPYNFERDKKSMRSFRTVVLDKTAHCLEGALAAACILEQHDYPPLLLSLDSVDELGHVVFLFKKNGLWGSVGRSRDAGLHGRKPIFRTPRDVALSYFDPYVDLTGRIDGYAVVDLNELGNYDWRFSKKNLWKLHDWLVDYKHVPIRSSETRYQNLLAKYKLFREENPDKQATYYDNKHQWM